MQVAIVDLKKRLQVTEEQQIEIEVNTRGQSDNELWQEYRKNRITASIAHSISALRRTTDNTSTINKYFGRNQFTKLQPLMEYGRQHENTAVDAYEVVKGLQRGTVRKCGLFVSLENGIFAASPDGLLGDDGLLEVKCPPSIKDIDPKEWPNVNPKQSYIVQKNGELQLRRKHQYYYQVVMQIYVTNRQWCDFFVWTPKGHYLERISRDSSTDKLWKEMKMNMEFFWDNDLAPELVDSRFDRGYKEYRYPITRKNAVDKKKTAKTAPVAIMDDNAASTSSAQAVHVIKKTAASRKRKAQ